jgi:hypothetical protein
MVTVKAQCWLPEAGIGAAAVPPVTVMALAGTVVMAVSYSTTTKYLPFALFNAEVPLAEISVRAGGPAGFQFVDNAMYS